MSFCLIFKKSMNVAFCLNQLLQTLDSILAPTLDLHVEKFLGPADGTLNSIRRAPRTAGPYVFGPADPKSIPLGRV